MEIVFFGTSPRSAIFLEKALKKGLKVDLIVSAPPKPIGKKQILTENPVVTLAKEKMIPFILKLDQLDKLDKFPSLSLGFILDFQQIIPRNIIDLFERGIINVHFSKLPLLRGPAPVQYTILSGGKEGWITYYLINEKLDAGPIVAQTSLPLDLTENTEDFYQKLIEKSAQETPKIIDDYLKGVINLSEQEGTPTFTKKLTAENCKIDWKKTPEEIDRLIRAANPEPGAWTVIEVQRFKGSKVQSKNNAPLHLCTSAPKQKRLKILKAHLDQEKLILDTVQLEGKNPVSWKQFQEGHPNVELKQAVA